MPRRSFFTPRRTRPCTPNSGTNTPNPTPALVGLGAGTTVASVAAGPEALHSLVITTPPPVVSGLAQTHSVWREGIRGVHLTHAQRRIPVGTSFAFSLNTPSVVHLTFSRRVPGRLVGGRCVAATRANRTRRACSRSVPAGQVTLNGSVGPNSLAFAGRVSSKKRLGTGSYTVSVTALAGQLTSAPTTLRFTIARG